MERSAQRPWWRAHSLAVVALVVLVAAGAASALLEAARKKVDALAPAK